jgi:mRNA interferase MazF
VKRGEIWTAAGGGEYGGKPRPVVIVGDDLFADLPSVTVCGFTTHASDAPLIRLLVAPTAANGLRQNCWIMVDKIITVPRSRLGARLGQLDAAGKVALGRALAVYLGLAGSDRG